MASESGFHAWIDRVRRGDRQAEETLAVEYREFVRRQARQVIRDPVLRRAFDSSDICQSVLIVVLRLLRSGYEPNGPGDCEGC